MKGNKFLVVLKTPPLSFIVDNFDTSPLEQEVGAVRIFTQDGLLLFVTKHVDANIAYVQEITQKMEDDIKKRVEERLSEKKIFRPEYLTPKKRRDS